MKKISLVMLCWLSLSAAASGSWNSADVRWNDHRLWKGSAEHSVEFFNRSAWMSPCETYLTRIDAMGNRLAGEQRGIIALSRMLYGLSQSSELLPAHKADYVARARSVAEFILQKMVRRDAVGEYFLPVVDSHGSPVAPTGEAAAPPEDLVVNEQAYGLNGLVALYKVTADPRLLERIHDLYGSFYRRFHDAEKLGFFDKHNVKTGAVTPTKSYNSTVYVATSFLFELAEADPGFSSPDIPAYRATLTELLDQVVAHFLDSKTGWLVENFDRDWNAAWRDWQRQPEGTIGVVGHNFQTAWLLLRQVEADPLSAQAAGYKAAAKSILEKMLAKPVIDQVNGGFFDVFARETDKQMWHTNKAWWQQAEGILALTLAERLNLFEGEPALARSVAEHRDRAVAFYFRHFVDMKNGGEFPEVQADGTPLSGKLKGDFGKSTYHTVELARYMLEYARGPAPEKNVPAALLLPPTTVDELLAGARQLPIVEGARLLGGGIGGQWSATVRMDLARRINRASSSSEASRSRELNTVRALIAALGKQTSMVESDRAQALVSLGYTPVVARRISGRHPRLADEILTYAAVDPAAARPKTLYRGLAISGGAAAYSPTKVSTEWFSEQIEWAVSFGGGAAKKLGVPLVVLEIEIPAFMHGMSPLMMGDVRWPILEPEDFPDPAHPDLAPFLKRIGSRNANEDELRFRDF